MAKDYRLREISLADALERISQEKGAVILGLSIHQILCITKKIHMAGINSPFTNKDIESLKIEQ